MQNDANIILKGEFDFDLIFKIKCFVVELGLIIYHISWFINILNKIHGWKNKDIVDTSIF